MPHLPLKPFWVSLSILGMLALAGCGEDDGGTNTAAAPPTATASPVPTASPTPKTSADYLQRGAFSVGVTTMTFVDTSRPTMPNGPYAGAPTRTLVTEIWYPTAFDPASPSTGTRNALLATTGLPFPLIVYSHGFTSSRTGGAFLAQHLASYGYIVASPDFPLTNGNAPGGPNFLDLANQPGDVHFLIDQLLALNADPHSVFASSMDAERIGLTGLSLGGSTTFLATFHSTLRDTRVRAAAPMAGETCFFGPAFYDHLDIPLMIVHGDIDAIVTYEENAPFAFHEANAPKYLVTLINGSHTAFADGIDTLLEHVNNPDDIGCAALGNVASSDSGPNIIDLLGGAAAGIIEGNCAVPCQGPKPRPRSMRPSRQHQLTILSIFPFFEATLRGDLQARQFIEQVLPAENTDLTLQFQR